MVSKSRRKVATTMNDVFQEVDDWEKFAADSRIQGLLDPEDYPKNSAMYKINSHIGARSPEQQQKIKKANLALALASHNQSFANVADLFQSNNPNNISYADQGESSQRQMRQRLINNADDNLLQPAERGSSLFIKRVADLEGSGGHSGKKQPGSSAFNSEASPFQAQ